MCLILQGTRVQVQALKPCKSVQETSEKMLFIRSRQLTQQVNLLRFNKNFRQLSTEVVFIEDSEIQIFKSVFHAYLSYLCRVYFLITLDICKDYFKGPSKVMQSDTTQCKLIVHANCDRRQNFP